MKEDTPSGKTLFKRAKALERNHQIEQARELYQSILQDNPGHKKARLALKSLTSSAGRAVAPLTQADFERVLSLANNDLSGALKELVQLCKRHPTQPALENLRGVILSQMGAYPEAVEAFRRALEIEPRFSDALNNLASALSKLGRDLEAVKCFERLLASNRNDADIYYNYGNTLRKLKRSEEAISAYKLALSLRPSFLQAYNNMGNALITLGQTERAQNCYENVLDIDPNHDQATRNLAQSYYTHQQFDLARSLYQRLLSRNPGDVSALNGIANSLTSVGNIDAAIEALEQVLAVDPSTPGAAFLHDALSGTARDRAPSDYTRLLFDEYADSFEEHLTLDLQYRTPTELHRLLTETVPGARFYQNALDIGCGTGLVGEAFQGIVAQITGIDLSPAMLAKAGEKALYHNLLAGDAIELLEASTDEYDLILCSDTLPYLGDLNPIFSAIASSMQAGSHFLCSVELADDGTFKLQSTARFAHSAEYVIACAAGVGLDLLAQETIPLRKDRGNWITGGIYCFVRRV